jgi:FkbM family methyltransferase
MKAVLSAAVRAFPPLYRQINRVRKFRLHEPNSNLKYRVLGSSYGGWGIPENYLHSDSIVYTVGIGEDISFDLAIAQTYGCNVFAFDPTPIAVEFMRKRDIPDGMTFVPIGLSSSDGLERFFTPQTPGFHSFSRTIDATQGDSTEVFCEVLTLKSMMKRLDHSHVDLVKMDIEGFEYEVIEEMTSSGTKPRCLLIEFHHLAYGIATERTFRAVENLLAAGYRIFWISQLGREYGFILGT